MLLEFDQTFLKKQLKILPANIDKWKDQELQRLLALIKIPQSFHPPILSICESFKLNKIPEALDLNLNQLNFFPFLKLKIVINFLIGQSEEQSSQLSQSPQKNIFLHQQIRIPQENIIALKAKVDALSENLIISLSSFQIANILKESGLDKLSTLIKKYSIDGFSLVCSLTDWDIRRQIMNYFQEKQIQEMSSISIIFVAHYLRQLKQKQSLQFQKKESSTSDGKQMIQQFNGEGLLIERSSIAKKMSEDEIDDQQLGESDLGESIFGNSQTGQTSQGMSEFEDSEYAMSQRGSVYAESVYQNRESVDCRMSFRLSRNVGRASAMYDVDIFNQLKDSCLKLPFDLLNLQSLQVLKLRAMSSAFSKEKSPQHWQFSVKGVKFGRDKDNDLSYPDQMSISSKHARITFKNDMFFLQDLGSKTGTYLRINKNQLLVEDQTCIQFPPEVQIVFKIIKKTPQEGVIKAEIKKPENFPDYKISLKQGFKIKIGKSSKCHIHIKSSSMADKHSEITYKNGNFYFRNYHPSLTSWHRLSPKAVRSDLIKLSKGDVFRLSSKKSFYVEQIKSEIAKN